MSPASYLTAPPRVAASIVAPPRPNRAPRSPGYHAGIGLLTWISLLFLVVATLGSGLVLFLRGRALWRTLKEVGGAVADAVAAVERSAAAAEKHAASLADGSARLEAAIARLEASLAQLAVLRAAAGDVRGAATGVRRAVPRK
jgi:hypothetical protein